jgi:hypothetical protein
MNDASPRSGRNSEADEEQLEDIGYEPQVNQVRHEPMPASADDEQRQEAIERNEQLGVPGRDQDERTLYGTEDQEEEPGD